ncbi:hypothetical protein [Amycolatopsis japonica]|uniref:hypothetical protein n=1 Tax=Amycolatopsis japonica TaxID=208439 RepID=UPI000B0593C7|nr:hypothetical protein [Amycolatopsis japonica]
MAILSRVACRFGRARIRFLEERFLAEVHVRIGTRSLALVAGELETTPAGGLLSNGSTNPALVVTDFVAVARAAWNMARQIRRF